MMLDNARFWLSEYHADGLRLDATHAIHDASPRHILAEITEVAHAAAGPDRAVVLIAETGENDVRYLRSVQEGGFGFDAVYADDFHHALRRYLAGDHDGYYADFDGTLEEMEVEDWDAHWSDGLLEAAEAPEDWSGSVDIERGDTEGRGSEPFGGEERDLRASGLEGIDLFE